MRTVVTILIGIIVLLSTHCKQESASATNSDTEETDEEELENFPAQDLSECQPYFTYDKIVHATIAIDDDSLSAIKEKQELTLHERKLLEILFEDKPKTLLGDSITVQKLKEFNFTSRDIPASKFQKLNEVFCERHHGHDLLVTLCIPNYRDILVFMKAGKIIGVAKLCLKCEQYFIIGTNRNTSEFGQTGDFKKLKELLK